MKLLVLVSLFLFAYTSANAQNGSWTRTQICGSCEPWGMVSGDSDTLVVITGSLPNFTPWRSTNGGIDWTSGAKFTIGRKSSYDFFDMLPNGHIFIHSDGATHRTTTGGADWSFAGGLSGAVGSGFFSPDSGLKLVREGTVLEGRVSPDSGATYIDKLFEHDWSAQVQGLAPLDFQFDSPDLLFSLFGSGKKSLFGKSTDRGQSWTYSTIGESQDTRWFRTPFMSRSPDGSRIYAAGGLENSSAYYSSTDRGTSWQAGPSRAASRVYRLIESTSGAIWMAVGAYKVEANVQNLYELFVGDNKFADTILASFDGGDTWAASGDFSGHIVLDLLSGKQGKVHVLTQAGSAVFVSTFTPVASVNVAPPEVFRKLQIHPNPSSEGVRFISPATARARITISDVLGQIRFESSSDMVKGRSEYLAFPPSLLDYSGPMFLRIEYGGQLATQSFVKY